MSNFGTLGQNHDALRLTFPSPERPDDPLFAPSESYPSVFPMEEPVPPVPAPFLSTSEDTIRGGKLIVFAANASFIDTSRDRTLREVTLPAGWSTVVSGTGAVSAGRTGVACDSGLTSASTAGLESTDTYLQADVAVDVELVHPTGATASAVDLAVLEARSASGSVARVRLRRGFGADSELTVAYGDITPASGPVVVGGIADAAGNLTLRIVRDGVRVWGFVGTRTTDGGWASLVKVLDYDRFASDAGVVRFYVGNVGVAGRVLTRFTNYTVRSHARIGSRLVDDKVDISTRRFTGLVPAATVEEVGLHDISVFGLFGELVYDDGFRYVLPPPKTVGRESTRTLFVVQDPILKDGA